MEQTNAFAALNFDVPWSNAINLTATQTKIATFLCPSDSQAGTIPNGWGGTNYRSNEGTSVAMWHGEQRHGGRQREHRRRRTASSSRTSSAGSPTSPTARATRRPSASTSSGDFNNSIATDKADTFWPQTYPANPDEAVQLCRDFNWRDLTYQRVSDVGAPWIYGYHSTTSYWHSGPPNSRSCMFPPSRIMTVANSRHPGGVNVALADGSVKFVKDTINLGAWRALGTRNLGEVISADAF